VGILKKLGIDRDKMAVFGSGPLCVRGLRDFHDLDLIVARDVFEEYRKDHKVIVAGSGDECIKLLFDEMEVEIFYGWKPGEWDIKELIENADIIDGYRFVKLEEVVKWKKIKGREKDWQDVKLIEEYWKNEEMKNR
jgi:hypothetical protein